MAKLTVEKLAKVLADAFDEDMWGDIDPEWFKLDQISDATNDPEDVAAAMAMRDTLQKAVDALNEEG